MITFTVQIDLTNIYIYIYVFTGRIYVANCLIETESKHHIVFIRKVLSDRLLNSLSDSTLGMITVCLYSMLGMKTTCQYSMLGMKTVSV